MLVCTDTKDKKKGKKPLQLLQHATIKGDKNIVVYMPFGVCVGGEKGGGLSILQICG